MAHTLPEVRLWVRPEVHELGVIPFLPPDKISVEMLSRLLQSTKELGLQGYPTITYEAWKQLAFEKMGLRSECAEFVFSSCRLFSQRCVSDQQQDVLTCDSTVATLELITLLYLQRVSTTHPRLVALQASMHTLTNDPWPGSCPPSVSPGSVSAAAASGPPSCNGSTTSALHSKKKLQEEYNQKFVKDSLSELLSLLAGHIIVEDTQQTKAQKRRSGEWRSLRELLSVMKGAGVVGVEVVRALDFLIGVTLPDRKNAKLLDVATDRSYSYQSGYLSKKNTFQKGLFEQWVVSRLDWAPHGEWLCLQRGRRPSHWPVASDSHHWKLHCNPPLHTSGERLACISDLTDGITVHLGDATTNTTPKKPQQRHHNGQSSCASVDGNRRTHIEEVDEHQQEGNEQHPACSKALYRSSSAVEDGTRVTPMLYRSNSSPFTESDTDGYSLAVKEDLISLLDLKVKKTAKAQIYVLRPLRHVLLHKVYDTKVVLGPVRGRLRIMECRNVTIICPARSIVISDCRNVTLYTLTPQRPLVVGGCSSTAGHLLTLAPLNMHYPKLLHHLCMTGIKATSNKWNQPLKLGNDGRSEQSDCVLLAPEEFQLLALPFFPATVDGRPPLLPPGLPNAYGQSVKQCQQTVCSLRAEVKEAALTADERAILQKHIDHRFKIWLKETNKQRELDLLDKLASKLKLDAAVS